MITLYNYNLEYTRPNKGPQPPPFVQLPDRSLSVIGTHSFRSRALASSHSVETFHAMSMLFSISFPRTVITTCIIISAIISISIGQTQQIL